MGKVVRCKISLVLMLVLISGCAITQIKESRVERNEQLINEVSRMILSENALKFNTKLITNKNLKRKLKKLHVKEVRVNRLDSTIELSRFSGFLNVQMIIVDYSKNSKSMNSSEYKKIHDKIYYHTYYHVIS